MKAVIPYLMILSVCLNAVLGVRYFREPATSYVDRGALFKAAIQNGMECEKRYLELVKRVSQK